MALAGWLAAGLVAACDDKPPAPAPTPAAAPAVPPALSHARRVAEEKIRSGLRAPAAAQFRGMQAYQQADARVVAVCGQVNASGREEQAFVPFVAVVTYARRPEAGAPDFEIEPYVGTSNAEATRVYIEMTSRCGENGGPRMVGTRQVIPALPPLPSDLPDQIQAPQPLRPGQPPAGQFVLQPLPAPGVPTRSAEPVATQVSGQSVTMRQAGNIRISPVGGSQLVRVAPRGAVLTVFAQAPGGWLQVGEGGPEGWVHSSLVDMQ